MISFVGGLRAGVVLERLRQPSPSHIRFMPGLLVRIDRSFRKVVGPSAGYRCKQCCKPWFDKDTLTDNEKAPAIPVELSLNAHRILICAIGGYHVERICKS